MNGTPTFANPPIVELVLGAQFSPLTKMTAGHFGLFWKELPEEWTDPEDRPILVDQFELFDHPRQAIPVGFPIQLEPVRGPERFLLGHQNKDRLIQMQATRFHLNWRKRDGFYPSYKSLIGEFEEMFARFTAFTEKAALGRVNLNQWELTYIDAFPQGEHWQTPSDWARVLPGLFSNLFPLGGMELELGHRAAEWSYEIKPKRGRLHIAAQQGLLGDDRKPGLMLQMTARGPIGKGGVETLREGLDLGHTIAVEAFLRVVAEDILKQWGTK
jgi:uncharacterized protein (TIGR04255 family)